MNYSQEGLLSLLKKHLKVKIVSERSSNRHSVTNKKVLHISFDNENICSTVISSEYKVIEGY